MPSSPLNLLLSVLDHIREAANPRTSLRPYLQSLNPTHLLAFGKASLEMADEALLSLSPSRGIITCVPERLESLPADRRAVFEAANIRLLRADHPFATERNLQAAEAVRDFVSSLSPTDQLLVLLSGGGSAHLTLPAQGLTLDHLRAITKALQRAGRTINDLNCVRKHCEQLKGGRLAALSKATTNVLILSDVLGDPLDVISSGPFAPDPTTFAQALAIVNSANAHIPEITAHLERGVKGELPETPKPGDAIFDRVHSTVIASNVSLVESIAAHIKSRNIAVEAIWHAQEGEATALASRIAAATKVMQAKGGPCALIIGGEWTVHAGSSSGRGGPSQELALALALYLQNTPAAALIYSTDGIDGPTNAAGAIITDQTTSHAAKHNIDLQAALINHDSHTALTKLHGQTTRHIRSGPTGTNLNHIAVVIVE